MYRKKSKKQFYKKIRIASLIFALMVCYSFISLGLFWTPPDYFKDGTANTEIEAFARYGGDWIEYSQKWDGSFYYIYYPNKDSYSSENNILRHAGTVYAILQLYEYTEEIKYLYVAYRGISFLLKYLGKVDENTFYIEYNDKVKLGGAALCVLCLAKYKELTNTYFYDEILEKLGNFILYMQEDEGWFRSIYYYKGDYNYNWNSSIYPGEAMLSLIRLYKTFNSNKYLNALENAYRFYANNTLYNSNNAAFIPWTTSAFVEAYEETKKNKYADFVFEMTDYQISWQLMNDKEDKNGNNLKGSFGSEPTINAAVYLEGIGDAYKLAIEINKTGKISNYYSSLMYGIEWVLSLQYRYEEIEDLKNPRRSFGGFHLAFSGDNWDEIRVDYTQHSVSAILKILNNFSKKQLNEINIR
ncbi:MAG: hypothetical protein ACTSQJ_00835 [Promethearchaeota archaeon]